MNRFYPWKVYRNIVRMYISRTFLHRNRTPKNHRSQDFVSHDYTTAWSETAHDIIVGRRPAVYKLNGRLILCRAIDSRKITLQHISSAIRSVAPKHVLELGSGIGINILILAVLNPEVKSFKGIELTKKGVEQAKAMLQNPPIEELIYLTECDEQTIRARLAHRDIEFVEGDILRLPWKDKTFDFVFTCWVIEQIPRDYKAAFLEAKRVLSGHAIFIEEFYEAQENMFQRLHLHNVDYFHASYHEVEALGFKTLRFEPMPISKIKLTYGSLFCEANRETK